MARDKNLEELKQKQLEKELREQENEMEMTDSGRVPNLQDDLEDKQDEEKQ
ncbi:hypothetical protein QOZ98_002643 [Planomicrobium stackebrandtii]|uniref:Uncharacterized protein n=1 Tax=Planomicrobium stackebrandtii TaxID=253160 RepID=A0ABU0GWS3_9BACL|nr:hypothetical protein [Planomicrobium stackebrandtii]MDQ0429815.1 hypothetical protein [Planomicrobium stackebrandtii]